VRNPTGIVRNAIGKDLTHFLLPWILTMVSAVAMAVWEFSGRYGDQDRGESVDRGVRGGVRGVHGGHREARSPDLLRSGPLP
jgi:hypothetical protein